MPFSFATLIYSATILAVSCPCGAKSPVDINCLKLCRRWVLKSNMAGKRSRISDRHPVNLSASKEIGSPKSKWLTDLGVYPRRSTWLSIKWEGPYFGPAVSIKLNVAEPGSTNSLRTSYLDNWSRYSGELVQVNLKAVLWLRTSFSRLILRASRSTISEKRWSEGLMLAAVQISVFEFRNCFKELDSLGFARVEII
jgi:hypothetical protein